MFPSFFCHPCRDPRCAAVSLHHLAGNRSAGLPGCGAPHQRWLHHRGHYHAHYLWLCCVGQYYVSKIHIQSKFIQLSSVQQASLLNIYDLIKADKGRRALLNCFCCEKSSSVSFCENTLFPLSTAWLSHFTSRAMATVTGGSALMVTATVTRKGRDAITS